MTTIEKINSIIEDLKNVKRGLLNNGLSEELATKICKIAEFEECLKSIRKLLMIKGCYSKMV